MTEKDILRNIRKNEIPGFIVMLIFSIIPNSGIYAIFAMPKYRAVGIFLAVFAVLFDYILIKSLIIIINPLKDPVFRKYGPPKKIREILEDLNNNIVYEDDNIIMSKKYILQKK